MSEDPLWIAIKRLNWAKAKCRKGIVPRALIRMLERRVAEEAAKVVEVLGPNWEERLCFKKKEEET